MIEKYDFDYASKINVYHLDEKFLTPISAPIKYGNNKEILLNKLDTTNCTTHDYIKLPHHFSEYASNNCYWFIALYDDNDTKRPCIILENYRGMKDGHSYFSTQIDNLIYFKGSKLIQKVGTWDRLRYTHSDITKGKWSELIKIYTQYHLLK